MNFESLGKQMPEADLHFKGSEQTYVDFDMRVDLKENRRELSDNMAEFDPDKRVEWSDNFEKNIDVKQEFNPDKRVEWSDSLEKRIDVGQEFDPDKRVEWSDNFEKRIDVKREFDLDKRVDWNKNFESSENRHEDIIDGQKYYYDDNGKEGLTDEEKQRIKRETGWSDEIIDNIRSMKEYEIYKKAGLQEVKIGDKTALIRNDIDWNQIDEKGRTNEERIKRGLAPLDKDGNPIELHHIGQHADSPLAELTFGEHRCDGNDTILHDKNKDTETHGEGNKWDNERQNYWKDRAQYNEDIDNNKGGEN